jgi:hypothetical protein
MLRVQTTTMLAGSLFASTLHRGPAPDAAQYSVVRYDADYAPGGSSLMSRASRFADPARTAPDPGAYEVRGTLGKRSVTPLPARCCPCTPPAWV